MGWSYNGDGGLTHLAIKWCHLVSHWAPIITVRNLTGVVFIIRHNKKVWWHFKGQMHEKFAQCILFFVKVPPDHLFVF